MQMAEHKSVARIIRANLAHLDNLLPLFVGYLRFYEQDWPEEQAREFMDERFRNNENVAFMAMTGKGRDEPAGFVNLYPGFCSVSLCRIYTLYDLYVGGAYRQQGIARQLMTAAHEYCASHGAGRVDLSTAFTNTTAQPLYESMGYERDKEFYYYSLDLNNDSS